MVTHFSSHDSASRAAAALKARFDELGYCVVDDLWNDSEIEEIEAFFEQYKREEHFYEGGGSYTNIDKTRQQMRAIHPHGESRRALD